MVCVHRVAVSPLDIPPSRDGSDIALLINGLYVFTARPLQGFPQGQISMSDPQRTWAQVALTDMVEVRLFDPFSQGSQAYLAGMDLEVGFAGKKRTEVPYDQDELSRVFIKVCITSSSSGLMLTSIEFPKPNPCAWAKDYYG